VDMGYRSVHRPGRDSRLPMTMDGCIATCTVPGRTLGPRRAGRRRAAPMAPVISTPRKTRRVAMSVVTMDMSSFVIRRLVSVIEELFGGAVDVVMAKRYGEAKLQASRVG
jgi:hypothetical protein